MLCLTRNSSFTVLQAVARNREATFRGVSFGGRGNGRVGSGQVETAADGVQKIQKRRDV
jgi:hypothetical protein